MKKSIMLMLALTAIICSCGESDSTQNTQHDIWVMGYMAYSPTSTYDQSSTEFLFYKNTGNSKLVTSSKTLSSVLEFDNSNDDIYKSLCKDGGMQLENGQTVYPIEDALVTSSASSYKTVNIPVGSYIVVAISRDPGSLWTKSQCSEKYCIKNIDVKDRPIGQEIILRPVFPCDYSRMGLIQWTDYNDRFTYTWSL